LNILVIIFIEILSFLFHFIDRLRGSAALRFAIFLKIKIKVLLNKIGFII